MEIVTRWFSLQGPRRADLSGVPFGVLFVWHPHGRKWSDHRFEALPGARQFGFFLPFPRRKKGLEYLEVCALDQSDPHIFRDMSNAAVAKAMKERPRAKIAIDRTRLDRRIDLSNRPWQFHREIGVTSA